MQIETDLKKELEHWGWWVRACPSKTLNYPSSEPYAIVKSGDTSPISDERAVEIDQAIAYLFGGDKELIRIIKLKFVCELSIRDIAKRIGTNKDQVARLLDSCVSWLTGYFVGKRNAA